MMTEKSLDFADNKYANLKDIVVFISSIFVRLFVDSQAGFSMFSADSIYLWDKQQHRQPHNLLFFKISF
jgi:hypothetical protein